MWVCVNIWTAWTSREAKERQGKKPPEILGNVKINRARKEGKRAPAAAAFFVYMRFSHKLSIMHKKCKKSIDM